MTTPSTNSDPVPPLRLHHGEIPHDMLWDTSTYPPGSTGWWVPGLGFDECNDELPYVLAERSDSLETARRHFDPIVGGCARRLLSVSHDIVVFDWHRLSQVRTTGGDLTVYEPNLLHERHDMTIYTVDGQFRSFRDLTEGAVNRVLHDIEAFDTAPDPEDDRPRRRATTVCLNIPVPEDREGDRPMSALTTIRIATIIGLTQERRVSAFTGQDLTDLREAWAKDQAGSGR